MAFINKRTTTTGEERYRVGYIENGKQRFTPTLETAEGAAEMKNLIETIGPAAALASSPPVDSGRVRLGSDG